MSTPAKPTVTIAHSLPGRLRVRLSRAPANAQRMVAAVMEHDGLESVHYTPATGSVLVRFDPHRVASQEIMLRVALHLSLDHGTTPVRLLAEPQREALNPAAVYSAVALGAAGLLRWLRGGTRVTLLERIAGVGTALAVAEHAWEELQQRGYFDPEVLSLAYLVTAFARGEYVKASTVTWLTSFGRHLLAGPQPGVQLRPVATGPDAEGKPRYELAIGPDTDAPEQVRAVGAVQGLIKFAISGGGAHSYRNLWEELRDVSRVHGEVLEGFGPIRHGIPIRFD